MERIERLLYRATRAGYVRLWQSLVPRRQGRNSFRKARIAVEDDRLPGWALLHQKSLGYQIEDSTAAEAIHPLQKADRTQSRRTILSRPTLAPHECPRAAPTTLPNHKRQAMDRSCPLRRRRCPFSRRCALSSQSV